MWTGPPTDIGFSTCEWDHSPRQCHKTWNSHKHFHIPCHTSPGLIIYYAMSARPDHAIYHVMPARRYHILCHISPGHTRSSVWNLTLIDPVVSEEKMFKECGPRRTTEAYLSYKLTFGSGELNICFVGWIVGLITSRVVYWRNSKMTITHLWLGSLTCDWGKWNP